MGRKRYVLSNAKKMMDKYYKYKFSAADIVVVDSNGTPGDILRGCLPLYHAEGLVKTVDPLSGIVIVRLGAEAGAVGAYIEHHKAPPGEFLGHVLHGAVDTAAAVVDDHGGHLVVAGGACGVVKFPVQFGAPGVQHDGFHLDPPAVGLDKLGTETGYQDHGNKDRQQPAAPLLCFQGQFTLFHLMSSFLAYGEQMVLPFLLSRVYPVPWDPPHACSYRIKNNSI